MDIELPQLQQLLLTSGLTLAYLAATLRAYDRLLSQREKVEQSLKRNPIPDGWVYPTMVIASLLWPIGLALRLANRPRGK